MKDPRGACPGCQTAVGATIGVRRADCRALQHLDCFEQRGGCAAVPCPGTRNALDVDCRKG